MPQQPTRPARWNRLGAFGQVVGNIQPNLPQGMRPMSAFHRWFADKSFWRLAEHCMDSCWVSPRRPTLGRRYFATDEKPRERNANFPRLIHCQDLTGQVRRRKLRQIAAVQQQTLIFHKNQYLTRLFSNQSSSGAFLDKPTASPKTQAAWPILHNLIHSLAHRFCG